MTGASEIFPALAAGELCITANNRLARDLRSRYDEWRLARGDLVWETPQILPQQAWLARSLDEQLVSASAARTLRLTPATELCLWERIIRDAEADTPLLHVASTARLAREAHALVCAWRVPAAELSRASSLESRRFLHWWQQFDRICQEHGWQAGAGLPDLIDASHVAAQASGLLLAGFDELTPQLSALVVRLEAAGLRVRTLDTAGLRPERLVRLSITDPDEELLQAACWARQRAMQNAETRIAVVVHDLSQRRAAVVRVFDEVLDEAGWVAGHPVAGRLYDISLGEPLAQCALIDTALRLIRFKIGALPANELTALLVSPYLAGMPEERHTRARLDAALRRKGRWQIDLPSLLPEAANAGTPQLYAQLSDMHASGWPRRATALQWRQLFAALLDAAGWSSGRPLDSIEFQTLEAWKQALEQFALTAVLGEALSAAEACAQLSRMVREMPFQPESAPVQIQVMGLLEAVHGQFDHVWITGLDDDRWPGAARPNPLLPSALQRRLGMPHSSAARELEYAERLTGRLLGAAGEVVVSYAEMRDDREMRVSPLISALPEISLQDLDLGGHEPFAQRMQGNAPLQRLEDECGLPVPPATAVQGGERLIADQAACPFRAYASHRLRARPLDEPEPGLPAHLQGTTLHRAMAELWQGLRTQQQLVRTDDRELDRCIASAVEVAMQPLQANKPPFGARTLDIERARIALLLREWLAVEKQRTVPFEVEACEQAMRARAGDLDIEVRVDRIDRLPDGRQVLIDYKTGRCPSVSDWNQSRLQSPQLPLYAQSLDQAPAALVYGWLRADEMRYLGDGIAECGIAGVPSGRGPKGDWDARITGWRDSIAGLAAEIRQGWAAVDPYRNSDCRYCPLPPLCRIEWMTDEEDDDGDA